ncbi:histidine phosphatase family protein [Fibrobacter sp. UWEL]|uniref:histidine phosphatase family protein n=1 Tax=Fibrobacter sp. UWEL TaxID=1896209 RepID=UPI00091B7228|nr:histidine phosphatase family protein [Fibrobacter sp. UWEL]SHL00308.1 Broad specificity phosphatase PhoE [Fibrobacter sp. UWEL]
MYRLVFLILPLIFVACKGHTGVESELNEDFSSSSGHSSNPSDPNSSNSPANSVDPDDPENTQGVEIIEPIGPSSGDEEVVEDTTAVEDASALPKCTSSNDGESFFVAAENALYFCVSGEWRTDVVEQIGVSCNDGSLSIGAEEEVPSESVFGIDTLTGEIVYRREGVVVAGIAEKGPFRHGASVTVVELDSAARLADSDRKHKACITSGNGSYSFDAFDIVSPYVRVETTGYYKNELTGGLSSEPVTLKSVTDLTERDSVNVNILTHLEAVPTLKLVEQSGYNSPIRMFKEQSLMKVLYAFGIKIEGFNDALFAQSQGGFGFGGQSSAAQTINKTADEVSLFAGDEFSSALMAISVMLQRHGSGKEMLLFADSIAQKIAGSGNWDDWTSRAHLADWLMALDINGEFNKIRKNVSSWGLGDVPDFEKHLRKFWTNEYQFPTCGKSNAGVVTHIGYSQSNYFGCNYQDTTKTKVRFTCDAELGRWRAATDIEKDTVGLGADTSKYDGALRPGVINNDKTYIYEKSTNTWRLASSDDVMDFTDVEDVYKGLAADESVVFVLRHAERTNETGSKGHLTDNGKAQAKSVGAKLKSAGRMYFAYSGYTRTLETCESIAAGAGLSASPDSLAGLNGEWFVKSGEPSIEDVSRWAYTGSPAGSFYDLEERSKELVSDYILANRSKLQKVNFYISHDRMILPFAVYASKGKVDLRFFDVMGTRNWINFLAGVAVIFDSAGKVRYVPVRGLDSGTMKL